MCMRLYESARRVAALQLVHFCLGIFLLTSSTCLALAKSSLGQTLANNSDTYQNVVDSSRVVSIVEYGGWSNT